MTGPRVHFTRVSRNAKTGPIPVSITESRTCPAACPLKGSGCYAEGGPLRLHWQAVDAGRAGLEWPEFLAAVRRLPKGQLWRHNQAGDLPGDGDSIDPGQLAALVAANRGRHGFTMTHKPADVGGNGEAIAAANAAGFTVNLSADDLSEADRLAALDVGPVVVVLPSEQRRATRTPDGRAVAICPAILADSVTCDRCGLCAEPGRKAIIGFPAHGNRKAAASRIAVGI